MKAKPPKIGEPRIADVRLCRNEEGEVVGANTEATCIYPGEELSINVTVDEDGNIVGSSALVDRMPGFHGWLLRTKFRVSHSIWSAVLAYGFAALGFVAVVAGVITHNWWTLYINVIVSALYFSWGTKAFLNWRSLRRTV